MDKLGERIKTIAVELTKIRSIIGTKGEIEIAERIYQQLHEVQYFRQNPENLRLLPLKGDDKGRKYVMAVIEGRKAKSTEAVLCLGHIDTVGVQDYAEMKDYATSPELLKEKLKSIQFSGQTIKDLESDRWIFGRGILDMKTGIAAHMAIAEKFAADTAAFSGSLIFVFVPDEEGDSAGMLSAVQDIADLARQKGLSFVAAIDTDYMTSAYPGDENKYVYIGSVGKLLPCFYLYGEETHVGEAFNGIDANLLASEVLYQLDLNTDFCDIADGEVTLPPVSLYQRDLKTEYSVQTANAVTMYFNYATHCSQPDEVLAKCKQVAADSFANVIKRLNEQYEKFCLLSKIPYHKLPWEVQVLTYEELYSQVKSEMGDELDRILAELAGKLKARRVDDREYSLAIVQEVHKYYSNQNSKIIVYFAPPYYPHNYVRGDDPREKRLLDAVDAAVAEARSRHDYKIVIKKFYPCISDLSYCSISPAESIAALMKNMPAWGARYKLPVEDIRLISMPVVNIGPYGKDAHKLSERICVDYSLDAMPLILSRTIEQLLAG